MDITVFIPTRGRTGYTSITTEELKKFSSIKPVIVCPANEEAHYRRKGFDVLVSPKDGIGPTRQFIVEQSATRGVVMLDDDMYYSRRTSPEAAGSLVRVNGKDLDVLLAWISKSLDRGYAHGGISARQGNQNIPLPHTDCIRVNNCHFFDREVFLAEGIRFDRLPVMEDFDVTLSLLLKGYPNTVIYEFCWSQRASGFKGGCSLYRTKELQAAAATKLAEIYPEFVKLVEKEATSGGGLFKGTRLDVNIQWLKAWAARQQCAREVPTPNLRRR